MKRLGACLWPLVWLGFCPVIAWPQFSPGPLSKAHNSLKGPTQCTSCHIGAGGNRRFRCLACHTEIQRRLAARQGLHSNLPAADQRDDACYKCHSEHNGEDFVPIRWDVSLDEFDHRKTGYPLEGGHAGLECRRCHNAQHVSTSARRAIRVRDLSRTYLGLTRECSGCHEDEHGGQLAADCERCHSFTKWNVVARFDHAAAKFRLTGAHQKVACQKCHLPVQVAGRAKPRTKFTGIAFNQCNACHQDPHRGAFSAPCASCHADSAWKPARNTTASFDHSRAKFPLLGKHSGLTCEKCHRTTDYSSPIAHANCRDCHKDVHGGQFLARAGGGECGACHTVDGWKPSTFTVASHMKSTYPLIGRHAAVACAGCHKAAGAQTSYLVPHDRCVDCHRDRHEGQFAAAYQDRCESCHTTESYRPSTFTLANHARTRFPLGGSHLAVTCGDCHKRPPEHQAGVYHFADLSCAACHADPHRWQQAGEPLGGRLGASGAEALVASARSRIRCETCHTVQAWKEISRFDHSATRFTLTGTHRAVSCGQCHHPAALSAAAAKIVFQDTPLACAGCHQDIHGGQFSSATAIPTCDVCHDTDRWKPARFDHERTAFPLTGAHQGIACGKCHKTTREVSGRMVLFYKPTPKDCASCHGPGI